MKLSTLSPRILSALCVALFLSAAPLAATAQLCGDSNVDLGEQCDDGNTADGDCCSATCQFEPALSSCADATVCNGDEVCDGAGTCQAGTPLVCDDGDLCSQDSCDAVAGCMNDYTPQLACNETMGKAVLKMLVSDAKPARNKVTFKWMGGTADGVDYGDPADTSDYALCIYDADGLVTGGEIPAGVTCNGDACWKAKGEGVDTTGFSFVDRVGANDGLRQLKMHSGAGSAWLKLKAKGDAMPISEFDPSGLTSPVTAQVVTSDADCWSTSFDAVETRKNEATRFEARHKADR